MSKTPDTALATMAQMFQRLLEMYGVDAVGLARQAGIDLAKLPAPTDRVQVDKVDAILELAIPLINDPALGLQAARCWHPANLGVLGYAWLSSSTLRTGLLRLARYYRLIGERGITEIEETPQGIKVRFWAKRGNPAEVHVAAVMVDIAMALLLDMCRLNAGASLRPVAVTLRRGAPDPTSSFSVVRFSLGQRKIRSCWQKKTPTARCLLPTSSSRRCSTRCLPKNWRGSTNPT